MTADAFNDVTITLRGGETRECAVAVTHSESRWALVITATDIADEYSVTDLLGGPIFPEATPVMYFNESHDRLVDDDEAVDFNIEYVNTEYIVSIDAPLSDAREKQIEHRTVPVRHFCNFSPYFTDRSVTDSLDGVRHAVSDQRL